MAGGRRVGRGSVLFPLQFLSTDRLIGSLVGIVAVFGFGWCGLRPGRCMSR